MPDLVSSEDDPCPREVQPVADGEEKSGVYVLKGYTKGYTLKGLIRTNNLFYFQCFLLFV